jgi:hypothetical protein
VVLCFRLAPSSPASAPRTASPSASSTSKPYVGHRQVRQSPLLQAPAMPDLFCNNPSPSALSSFTIARTPLLARERTRASSCSVSVGRFRAAKASP